MEELEKKVTAVRRRLWFFRMLDWCILALIGGLIAVNIVMFAFKLFEHNVEVPIISAIIVACALVAAIVASFVKRMTLFEAALAADASLNLRERLSSALAMAWSGAKHDQAYNALEDDARSFAKNIRPGRDFKYRMPRYAKHTIWPALGIVALYFVPQLNVLNNLMPVPEPPAVTAPMTSEERKEEADRIREVAKKVREKAEEDLNAEKILLAEKLERLAEDVSLGQKDKKDAVAEMSRINEDVKVQQRDMTKLMQPFKQIQGLQQAEQTKELQKDLKNQDFEAAAEKMKEIAQKLDSMSSEDQQELSQELQQLSEALKDNPKMAEALKKAAEAVKEMAEQKKQEEQSSGQQQAQSQQGEQNSGENSEQGQSQNSQQQQQQQANQQGGQQGSKESGQSQKQQGSEAAQQASAAMQQAQQQMEQMQEAMSQMESLSELQTQMAMAMSQSMSQGNKSGQQGQQGQQGQGQGQGEGQGKEGNPHNHPMNAGDPSQNEGQCQGGECDGSCGSSQCQGGGNGNGFGPGGAGTGSGFRPESAPGQVQFVDTFIPGQKNEGEIIAVFEVDALVPAGESRLDHTRVPAQIQQRAADAMVDNEIPVGLRNSVKDYFQAVNLGGSN